MTLDQLRTFVKVVDAGSFTRAAAALGSEKAQVSRVVAQLEKSLGVQLLERTTRSLSLTDAGREILERARTILAGVDETARFADEARGKPRGVLRITCGVEFGLSTVSRWVNGYLASYPDASADVEYTPRITDIVQEGFDIAIRIGPVRDSGLASRKLGELRYGLYACPKYLKRRGVPKEVADLATHDLLMFTAGSHRSGWKLRRSGRLVEVDGPARLFANNALALRGAALASLGIAQLPDMLVDEWEGRNRLVKVLDDWSCATAPIYALFGNHRYRAPKVRAFLDHVVGELERG